MTSPLAPNPAFTFLPAKTGVLASLAAAPSAAMAKPGALQPPSGLASEGLFKPLAPAAPPAPVADAVRAVPRLGGLTL